MGYSWTQTMSASSSIVAYYDNKGISCNKDVVGIGIKHRDIMRLDYKNTHKNKNYSYKYEKYDIRQTHTIY